MEYRQGDVFLARLNPSKGNEPGKDRPVVVVQSDGINHVEYPSCIIVPCSSIEMPQTNIRPILEEDIFKKKTFALLDQVRAVDVNKRFLRKMGSLSNQNLKMVLKGLSDLIS